MEPCSPSGGQRGAGHPGGLGSLVAAMGVTAAHESQGCSMNKDLGPGHREATPIWGRVESKAETDPP